MTIVPKKGMIVNGSYNGVWLSLVERYVRDVEAAGSNPVTPIKNISSFFINYEGAVFINEIIHLLIERITFIIRSGATISR